MRYKFIKNIIYGKALAGLLLFGALVLTGCANEDGLSSGDDIEEVIIRATVGGTDLVETRANNSVHDVTATYHNVDFFVRVAGIDREDAYHYETSRYQIPSGISGMLMPATGERTLNWFARDRAHEFYGWSMPFLDTKTFVPDEDVFASGITVPFEDSYITDTSNSSASAWTTGKWANGQILEKFFGGKTQPTTYLENGKYINLNMRHLVSKIMLKEIAVIDNSTGLRDTKVKGTITFYGMPKEVTFYPCSKDGEGKNLQPYATFNKDWDYPQDRSLTFAITNNNKAYNWEGHTGTSSTYQYVDAWYIPPEIDLSELTFKIQLYQYVDNEWVPDVNHGEHGAYFGNFRSISISRSTNGNNYDDAENPGSDATILHAGEYLILYINMMERGNPAVHGTIKDWESRGNRDGYAHVEQGMYTQQEFYDMQNAMGSNSSAETKEEFFMLHGSGRDTSSDPPGEYPEYENLTKHKKELKIFEIYEDIGYNGYGSGTTGTQGKVQQLYMPDGYILDGKGHTINMSSNTPSIGNVRDVYLRSYLQNTSTNPYTYTEYIVYIDKMGEVWTVDPITFEHTQAGYNVNTVNKNPATIDLKTGRVY